MDFLVTFQLLLYLTIPLQVFSHPGVLKQSGDESRVRVKRQATCGQLVPSAETFSFAKVNEPAPYRYPYGNATLVIAKRRVFAGLPAPPQMIRLRGEASDLNPNEGRIEVFQSKNEQYGMVCDGFWDKDDADVACRQLGFTEGAFQWPRGSKFGKSRIMISSDIVLGETQCQGSEKKLQDCPAKPLPICKMNLTAGVVCLANQGCPFGWSASNGMCYRIVEAKKTYEEAGNYCKTLNAKLLYILSDKDNNYVSDMLYLKWPDVKAVWTGGQWLEALNKNGRRFGAWVWNNGYQSIGNGMKELWFPGFYNWRRGKRPTKDFRKKSCIAMSRIFLDVDRRNQTTDVNYFWWDNISCKTKLAFVCQRPYFEDSYMERNCYMDRGVNYRGNVTRTDEGSVCEKWTAKGAPFKPSDKPDKGLGDHDFCRNPDNDIKPWCWTNATRGIYGFCNTKRCDLLPTASTPLFTRKVGVKGYGNGGCKKNEFFCPSNYRYKLQCLKKDQVCDGIRHCMDAEDENDDFCNNFACNENEFFCNFDKYCISKDRVCDGARDCSNGADERRCGRSTRLLSQFDCTNKKMLDVKKLTYGTDTIEECAAKCSQSANRLGTVCIAFNFLKSDGVRRWFSECQLLSKTAASSGNALKANNMSTYCEVNAKCEGDKVFSCKNKRCIKKRYKCNGADDCGDNSDEDGCKKLNLSDNNMPFKVRLAGGQNKWSGRVEVRYRGEWGLVCDDNFDLMDAKVICKEMGYSGAKSAYKNSQLQFGFGNGNYLMDEVKCTGSESSLEKCPFDGWKKSDCAANEVAGVVCEVNRACTQDEFRCAESGKCIKMKKVCDGNMDCSDNSDEESCHVKLKLVGGPNKMEGRVEISRNYIKGSICDDQFDDKDAQVICKQLGFNGKAKALVNGKYGGGRGIIWLTNLNCQGNEKQIQDCPRLSWASSNCDHSEDAGVRCNVTHYVPKEGPSTDTDNDDVILRKPWSQILNLSIPCGERPGYTRTIGRSVSGYTASPGLIPWQAGIRKFTRSMKYQGHHCGGTIISEYWVVTAAHCYKNNIPKTMYIVRVGDVHNSKNETGEQWFEIDQMITHPNWTGPPKYDFDLTLFKLKPKNGRGIIFNNNVQPACMPTSETVVDRRHSCQVSGWGSIGGFRYPKTLKVADIPVLPWERCKELYKDGFTRRMQCAGFEAGGIDTCQGDSGGPLVCKIDGKYTAWGQCSWGNGCALPNNPGVYARLQEFLNWIKLTIWRH